ncbi:MAG: hypothetical protein LC768_01910 [Acidobacteria bacterium]|nr:hypothetical protein [Acidobacteriota bacterium]MCA1637087.1 hypothetical protein [Acidobacteriota bacterium]
MELTKEYFDQQLGNLARKEDLESLASKNDLEQIKDDIRAIKTDMVEVKQVLSDIDKRDKEDSDAFAKTLVRHDERLTSVEQDIKQLKLKHTST